MRGYHDMTQHLRTPGHPGASAIESGPVCSCDPSRHIDPYRHGNVAEAADRGTTRGGNQPGGEDEAGGVVSIQLGALEIRPGARAISVDGVETEIGGRAYDILMTLLQAKGGIVSKDQLLQQVWATFTVSDSNLKVQVSLLRRSLGAERWRVKTVTGRGYMLVAHDARVVRAAHPSPHLSVESGALVVIVDGDYKARQLFMRLLCGMTESLRGATQLAVYAREPAHSPPMPIPDGVRAPDACCPPVGSDSDSLVVDGSGLQT